MRFLICAAIGALAIAVPAAASAGWYAKQSHATAGAPAAAKARTSDMFYGHHKLRIDNPDNSSVIIDLVSGDFTMIDHSRKMYATVTLDELVKMQNEMLAQMKAQLPKMPPEVRTQIEAQIKKQEEAQKADLKIKATKKTDTVAGAKCSVFTWTAPDGDVEACMATKTKVDTSAFRSDAKKLAKKLKKSGVGAGGASMVLLQVADRGFPLRTVRKMSMGGQTMSATSEILEMKTQDVPKTKVAPPKGYKKEDFKKLMMQPGGPR